MASFSPLAGRRSRQGDEGRTPSFQTQNRVAMWPRGCSMRSWWLPMAVAGGFRLSADGAGFEASALAPHPHLLPVHGEKGAFKPASSSWVVVRSCGGTKDLIQTWSLRPIRVRRSSMASFSPLAGRKSRQGDEGRAPSFQTGNPYPKNKRPLPKERPRVFEFARGHGQAAEAGRPRFMRFSGKSAPREGNPSRPRLNGNHSTLDHPLSVR